jgi:hypothetical protein
VLLEEPCRFIFGVREGQPESAHPDLPPKTVGVASIEVWIRATYKRVSSDRPHVAWYQRLGMKYIIHIGHSLGYLLAELPLTDIALKTG